MSQAKGSSTLSDRQIAGIIIGSVVAAVVLFVGGFRIGGSWTKRHIVVPPPGAPQ